MGGPNKLHRDGISCPQKCSCYAQGPTPTLSFFPGWFVTMSKCSDDSFNGTFQVGSTGHDTLRTPNPARIDGDWLHGNSGPDVLRFRKNVSAPQRLLRKLQPQTTFSLLRLPRWWGRQQPSAAPGANYVGALVRHDDTAHGKPRSQLPKRRLMKHHSTAPREVTLSHLRSTSGADLRSRGQLMHGRKAPARLCRLI